MVLSAVGRAQLWLWIWLFCSWSHGGLAGLQPMKPAPAPIPQFTSHSGQVCSTWGNNHFKTFNGDIYHYPGTCNYLFASHCKSNNEDFNIEIQRTVENGKPVISHITARLFGVVVEIRDKVITLDGVLVKEMPAEKARVRVDKLGNNIKITASNDIVMLLNGEDNLLLKLNRNKYANQTCGLCGDFSGVSGFTLDGLQITAIQYGNLQKRNIPTEECADVPPPPPNYCKDTAEICKSILTSGAFSKCNEILKPMHYIDSCVQDLCRCGAENRMECQCSMFAEYSRQCTHAGGVPGNWRGPDMCPQSCDHNMVYQEYGSPCPNTCSNTERTTVCEDHGIDGCFCPPGTVLDDINNAGCIPPNECSCVYNSEIYTPGSSFSAPCRECTCAKGKWKCHELPCKGTCSVEGGSHITSFDGSHYTINADCTYVLAKHNDFSVLVELRRCGMANKKSCMKSLTLAMKNGENVLVIKDSGMTLLNWIPTQLPVSVGNITVFWSTSFYINIHTHSDVSMQVRIVPTMQVHMTLGPSYHDQTWGLCGNFNNIQSDDFKTISGVSEGTAASFANAYKSNSNCPNIKNNFEDPCSLNIEAEKYAQHWCGLLTIPNGPFSSCHAEVKPLSYYTNCLWDTCSCQDSEECMCAALASYTYACAKKGVTIIGWRDNVCDKYTKSCKDSQVYQYNVTRCQPTCRSRSHDDTRFDFNFSPVDGCVCIEGTYMNDNGDCVTPSSCPCYYQGNVMQSGEMVEENGMKCTCDKGELTCMGAVIKKTDLSPVCSDPLVYLNCSSAPKGTKGVECQKSCNTLDMDCFSSQCVSGCVCPPGWVSDEEGGCISEPQCPCTHNEAIYQPGQSISVGCNTCTCKNRRWDCTHNECLGTCSVYGDGHYITFDNKQYTFSGNCEYVLVQDNCGGTEDKSHFKVITENVPCGSTGTTCSKTIKFFIGGHELRFNNERIEVVKRNGKEKIPCTVMQRGMYFIFKCDNGVILIWDKKTTIHTKLDSHFKGKVCGLCGNYDDKESNDFTTRSQSVVENLIEFCNTWKTDPSCPDVRIINDPCSMNPYRKNWALRQCSIIISDVFARCHSQVAPGKYYESCISDSCACDTGGDCECFCTTVALYAQACSQSGICINWRTPTICPMFCDYYNDVGDCEWHYKPCGDKCIKTCRNPKGECLHEVSGCEGCYPKCPPSRPFFNEDTMKCVAKCGCVDEDGTHYNYGERVKSSRNCDKCVCTMNEGIDCQYDINACVCEHEGKRYEYNTTITNDDVNCSVMKCGENGQIVTIKDICTTTKKLATDRVEIHTSTKATESTTNVTTLTTMATKSHSSTSSTDNDTSFPTTKILNPYSTGTAPPTSTTATSKVASSRSRSTSRSHSTKLTVTPNDTPSNTPETTQTGHSTSSFTSSSSTVIPKSKSTFSSHSTAVTQTATGAPSNTPETVETEHTTSSFTSSSSTVIPTTYMPCKEYECEWSKWFDDSHPTSEMKGGDQENFNTAEAKGTMVCPHGKVITDIKCRATSYSSIPLKELGQNVTCNKETGLLCRNEDNPENAYMCLNYEACYRCCKYYCPTSTPITTTKQSTISHSTASISDIYSSSPATETMSPPSIGTAPPTSKVASSRSKSTFPSHSTAVTQTGTRTPSNTPETVETEHTTSSFTSSSSTVIPTTYMPCKEYECEWSKWFDDSHPTSEMKGGDQENFNTAEAKGTMVCPHGKVITDIKCRATSYSSIPLKELGQNVTCNKETGLLCRNEDNPDNAYMCLNYEACYRCCKYYCPTSTPIATTKQSTISHSTASISDIYSSSPATETMSPPSIGTAPPTSKVASSRSKSTFPSHSTAVTQTGTRTPSNTPETVETEHTTSSFTSSSSTVIPTTYMPCKEYECEWSKWFDDSHPTSEMKGGDQENFNTAEAKGIMVCPHGKVITDIKCRATSYSSIPLKELGQNVTCNKETGLLCRNEDNPENAYMCLNYEACYRCCKYYCPTSTPITTTKQSTISHSTASITDIYSSSPATETMSPPSIGTAPPTSKVASSRSKSTFPSHSTAVTQTGTRTPSNTPETVETEHTTSSFTSSSSTVIPTTYMPCKEYECEWSKWFDDSHPTSEMKGGDQENFNTAEAKGTMVCHHGKVITDIKCRATSYSSIPLKELGQNVTCNKETGLLCRNEDNPDNAYMCLNYEACYRCCKYYCPTSTPIATTKQSTISHSTASISDIYSSSPATETMSPPSIGTAPPTSKVASSRSKSTFPSHSTAVTQTGTRTPSNTPETVENEHTTSSFTSSSSTVIPTTYMPCKEYECEWSKWFDDSHPTSEMKGGDQENFNTAEAKGIMVCPHGKVITDIKCRATSYSSIPLKELGQNVTCNKETGLLCRNEDNPENAYMCLNYEACYRCCKYYCPTSTPITTTKQSTISHSTASITDIYSSSLATETMSPPSIGTALPTSKVASSRSKSTFPSHSTAVTQTGTRTPSNTPETVETEHTTSSFTSSSSTVIPTTYMPCKEYECEWSKWFDDSHPTSEMKGGDQENFNTAEAKGIMVCPHGKVITDIKCRATSYSSIPLKELGQNVTCNKETGLLCRNEDNPENAYMCLNYEACYRCCKYYCPTSTPITTTKQSTISHSTASITDIYSSSPATETMSPPSIGTAPPTSKVASSRSKSTFPSHSTAVTQTGTRTPSNTPETVETEHTTSSFTSSSSTVIPTTYMPCKEYECEWSKWFDDSHPTSEMKGGDQENFNTAEAKGTMVCPHGKVITDIKCRATSYSSIPLKELGQNVTCNKETGLLCRNEDNPENAYMCLNYEACYRCCKYYCPTSTPITTTKQSTISHSTASISDIYSSSPATETMSPPSIGTAPPTSKVASSRSKSTFPSHSTAVTQTGTRTPSNTPETVETEHTTSSFTSTSSTVIPTTYMPCKEYECEWSKWFDDSHPTSEMKGGDQENFNTAEAKGIMVCPHGKVITDIKCRATSYSSIPLKELGQNVTCNKETGLLCRNEDNPENAYMCLNYEACYRCCKYYCPTSTPITTTKQSTISHSTASITDIYSSSLATETMSPPSIGTAPPTSKVASSRSKSTFPSHSTAVTQTGTRTPSNTPETVETEHTTSSFTSSSSTVIPKTYMPCKEYECEWSKWFDDSHPTSEMKGGDQENFNTAEAKGTMVCPHGKVITDIKCRATSYSSIPLKELGQNVTCNKETGLLCRNEDNPENAYMCLNYEACYRCCKYYCPTSTPITTTKQSTISHSTASISDIYSSSPATETMSPPSIGTAPPTSTTTTSQVASSRSKSTFPSHSTALTQTSTRTPSNTPETVETEHTTSSFTSSSSTIIPTTYMPCKEYECEWSKWFDQSHPTSDMKGGDQENFKLLEAKGIKVCPHGKVITDIQCRATSYSSIPIEELPQKVTCNKETGLLCMNENNPEYFNMCFNYEIRYNCCKSVCPSFPYISPTTSSVSTSGTRPVFISTLTPPESQTASSPLTEGGSKSSHQPVTTKISTVTERPHFCVHDGSIYKEGASVSIDPESCEECKCILLEDTSIVECRRMECSIECPLGYSYTELPGECCGKCVKNVCFFDATEVVKDESNKVLPEKCCENCDQDVCSKNNTLLIKPGKLWRVPGDNCTSYDCDPRTLKIVKKVMSCPVQRPLKCSQGILVNFTSADGCCTIQHCEPRKCDVMKSWKVIESEGCKANVTLTNCGGYCSSISRYPSFPKMVEHDCTCCQPTRTTEKKVHLQCEDGRKTSYKYTDVLQCACRGAECVFTE